MMMNLLKETGALLEGHYLLSSGKHSDGYVQCAKLLMYPEKAEAAIKLIIDKMEDVEFDMVVGPAMGGILVSYEMGRQTGKPTIFLERKDGEMTLSRGFTIEPGQKILIAEDVVTTGKSSYEAIKVVEDHGGIVVGVASIVDRSSGDLKYPLYSGVKVDLNIYDADECPLCKAGSEAVKPGSRDIK